MNCQEFKSRWEHSTDDAVLAHIETCDNCLSWIEKTGITGEEAMFLKEYPMPSADLEDRIMQAIYETAEKGLPLSAAGVPAAGETLAHSPMKRRFLFPTWVTAAGVLLAVGLIGGPLMLNQQTEQFAENAATSSAGTAQTDFGASSAASEAAAQADAAPQAKMAQAAEPQAPDVTQSATAGAEATQAGNATPEKNQEAALASSAIVPQTQLPAIQGPHQSTPPISARSRTNGQSSQPPAKTPASATDQSEAEAADQQIAALAELPQADLADGATAKEAAPGEEGAHAKAAAQQEPGEHAALAAVEEETEAPVDLSGGNEVRMTAAPAPLTVSTFSEVDSTVQASDLPVPTFAKAPTHYVLGSFTVHYESQTSKHATFLQTIYRQEAGSKQITLDVTPQEGKRSLSVPGEFTQTQVFQIDGEQAIGVTYNSETTPASYKSAVHYQTTQNNQSLYIVITADGMPLPELMELSKQIVWNKKNSAPAIP